MANFATLADLLADCATRASGDACSKLFAAATSPTGGAPTDTLTAAESIARYPWYQPEKLFALLDQFYSVSKGKNLRAVPFMPYLNFVPSAWVLPLEFDGGGYVAGGKAMFDSQGNLWVGDNFSVGWQAQDTFWQGNATKFAPNGRPLSPITTGFADGGMQGGTFGAAVDAKDNAWFSSYGGKSIAVFDKNGKPLIPFPGGQIKEGKIVKPAGLVSPFDIVIDSQNRVWVANSSSDTVVRFPANDPSKVETFHVGVGVRALALDSKENVWVANNMDLKMPLPKLPANASIMEQFKLITEAMVKYIMGPPARITGQVNMIRPDGTQPAPEGFTGPAENIPWGIRK